VNQIEYELVLLLNVLSMINELLIIKCVFLIY